MRGLIRADYYMIKAEIRTYLILLGFFAVFSFFTKSSQYIVTMQFVVTLMLNLSMMTADENGKDAYYQQLPFERKELVKEKYLRGFVYLTPFLLGGCLIGLTVTLFYGLDMKGFISEVMLGVVYLLLSVNIVIPITIKRGTSKSRLICALCVTVPSLLVLNMVDFFVGDIPGIDKELVFTWIMLGLAVLALLSIPLSYRLSVKYYQQKEF